MFRLSKRIVRVLSGLARVLEIVISIIVLVAIILQFTAIPTLFRVYVLGNDSMRSFHSFLDNILTLAIGLEFFRMLCFSETGDVLEVFLFVLAHHLLTSCTTALDTLLTVIAIAIIVLLDVLLKYIKKKMTLPTPEESLEAPD